MQYIRLVIFLANLIHLVRPLLEDDELLQAIRKTETERKLNLLTQFVALNWGFNGTTSDSTVTAQSFLEEVADFLLYNYNLTITQKLNSLKVKHILLLYQRTVTYQEHVDRAYDFDEDAIEAQGNLTSIEKERYLLEEQLIDSMALRQGQIATDLLVQSFGECNPYEKAYNPDDEELNEDQEAAAINLRRTTGTLNLANILLDPIYRLNMSRAEATTIDTRKLYLKLQERARANFEKVLEVTSVPYEEPASTVVLPTIMVNPSTASPLGDGGSSDKTPTTGSISEALPKDLTATGFMPQKTLTTEDIAISESTTKPSTQVGVASKSTSTDDVSTTKNVEESGSTPKLETISTEEILTTRYVKEDRLAQNLSFQDRSASQPTPNKTSLTRRDLEGSELAPKSETKLTEEVITTKDVKVSKSTLKPPSQDVSTSKSMSPEEVLTTRDINVSGSTPKWKTTSTEEVLTTRDINVSGSTPKWETTSSEGVSTTTVNNVFESTAKPSSQQEALLDSTLVTQGKEPNGLTTAPPYEIEEDDAQPEFSSPEKLYALPSD